MGNKELGPVNRQCGAACPTLVSCPTNVTGPCASFFCISAQNAAFGSLTTNCEFIDGNLTVVDNAQIGGNLFVESNIIVFGDGCIEGDLAVGETVTIGGNTLIEGSLTVNNGAIINGPLTVNGDQTINGNLTVFQNETINQNLTVGTTGTVNGLLVAQGGLSVFNGEIINNGGLVILSGGASINGDVFINGNQTVDNLDILGDLTVSENSFFNGCTTTINGELITNGPVTMNRGLTIASGNETIDTGDLILNTGNLTVGGFSTFNGPIIANNGATINKGLTVFGGQTIATGDLTVSDCGNVTIGGDLTVGGKITSPSAAALGSLTITSTVNSTSPTTGSLIVNGGVGIAQDLWLGGSQFFANVTTEGGTPSPFNYYEEACHTMSFTFDASAVPTVVDLNITRVGNIVNLIIPQMSLDNAAGSPGTVHTTSTFPFSLWELPPRFRPGCIVRGAASTIVYTDPVGGLTGRLGEFEVAPSGVITIGVPGPFLGPQPFQSTTPILVDINTITYNLCDSCTI